MPQRAVNVNITDWQTGGTFSGGTVDFVSMHPSPQHAPQIVNIQFQDTESGEWKTITDLSSVKGFNIDPTPTGFIVENYTPGETEITATFNFSSRVTDTRLRVDLIAAYMTPKNVYQFEAIQILGNSYYMAYCYKRYTAQLNHTQPCRKVSWRRLNWKQKARAIAIADECGWYDDYYYGRA
jgi:hypothetical protein